MSPVKINKKDLVMEEDDRFDSITLEDLLDGKSAGALYDV